ncbi:MAG: tetratricopeptide repeat protein [Acidobacteriota bacterium]|nr:tetratricopeptide repeat protein [Acidobacteriota bacterium]
MGGALTYLAKAQQLQPQQYDNGYDLAMADLMTGHFAEGRKVLHTLLAVHDTGELHNLLAQIEEKDGQYVVAANEFERAAHLDPSESALFDWGSELLLHRTYEPAIDVFKAAAQRYPTSSRLQIGLGMSYYARGLYEDAVKALLAAADLAPADARCYLFLSRASDSSPSQANEVTDRFARYAKLQPQNALAQYYYAMSLWRGARAQGNVADMQQVETLLLRAIALNDNLAEAHEQLGNLYADQKQYERSIPQYLRAVELDNSLADAHYRLGTDYVHLGHKDQAEAEFAVYRKLRAEHLAEVDKERSEVQQFVYDSKTPPPARP